MLRCHLAESQFVKYTKQTNKILRNHNLSARQKGYQSIDHKLNLFSFYFLRITRIRQHGVHTLHESPIYTTFYFLNFFPSVRNFNLVVDKTAELSTSLWCKYLSCLLISYIYTVYPRFVHYKKKKTPNQ